MSVEDGGEYATPVVYPSWGEMLHEREQLQAELAVLKAALQKDKNEERDHWVEVAAKKSAELEALKAAARTYMRLAATRTGYTSNAELDAYYALERLVGEENP